MQLTPARRRWVYRVALAAVPLLVAYGILSARDAALWVALVGAVVAPGLALRHTPRGPRRPRVKLRD